MDRHGRVENEEFRAAVQHAESAFQNLRTQARTAHAKQEDMLKVVSLDLFGEPSEGTNVRSLRLDDIEPAKPLILVLARPERRVLVPQTPDFPLCPPVFQAGFDESGSAVQTIRLLSQFTAQHGLALALD